MTDFYDLTWAPNPLVPGCANSRITLSNNITLSFARGSYMGQYGEAIVLSPVDEIPAYAGYPGRQGHPFSFNNREEIDDFIKQWESAPLLQEGTA
jgi:hypothetical protein